MWILWRTVLGTVAFGLTIMMNGYAAESRVISVCEALRSARDLEGKLVSVRGVQVATGEGAWLEAKNCTLPHDQNSWPNMIWLEMSGSAVDSAGFSSANLSKQIAEMNSRLEKNAFDGGHDRIQITVIGRFHAVSGKKGAVAGLGHMNGASAEIVVKDLKDMLVQHGTGSNRQ